MAEDACPHCGLPTIMPTICTPELNDVIEQRLARAWKLFNAGVAVGQQFEVERVREFPDQREG